MATSVNLDALIPRADFALDADGDFNRIESIQVRDLEPRAFFLAALRKPDFQRETASWTPSAILDLVKSFVDGDLIPGVILWQSGKYVFAIDGAHRLSAVIAWVQNDYGDGALSQKMFGGNIPEAQTKIATRTRTMVHSVIGSYADHEKAKDFPENATEIVRAQVTRLASRSIPVQWVPGADVRKAEKSFFAINQAGTPISPIETLILQSRNSANALSARAIVRGGTGYKYWKDFAGETRGALERAAQEIHEILYDPGLELPIKTLDIPIAGQSYGAHALPLAIDLVNLANGQRLIEATTGKKKRTKMEAAYPPDNTNGEQTLAFLDATLKVLRRISGNSTGSLGLHPAVYFYSPAGNFQPSALLGVVQWVQAMEGQNQLARFTAVRGKLEALLIANKHFISDTVHKLGSGSRSAPRVRALLERLVEDLTNGKTDDDIIKRLHADDAFAYLAARQVKEDAEPTATVGKKRTIRSEAFLRDALATPLRCPICSGLMHRNSMSGDHRERREDGGADAAANVQMTHFYCNNQYKEDIARRKRA